LHLLQTISFQNTGFLLAFAKLAVKYRQVNYRPSGYPIPNAYS